MHEDDMELQIINDFSDCFKDCSTYLLVRALDALVFELETRGVKISYDKRNANGEVVKD